MLAEWWQRFVALLFDGIIIYVPCVVLFAIAIAASDTDVDPATGNAQPSDGSATALLLLLLLFYFVVPILYYVAFHGGERGATPGKRIMRIRVADMYAGRSIGYGRAFVRWLVTSLLWSAFYIPGILDGLAPLWDERRQAWHDKAASSVVVTVPR